LENYEIKFTMKQENLIIPLGIHIAILSQTIITTTQKPNRTLLSLSKNGVSLPKDSIVYTTTFPCDLCANKIVSAGIKKVVFAEPYSTKKAIKLFDKNDVILKRFEGVKSSAYFRLYP
ncbi:MAG: deaminase, partial [Gemmatimonadota bacterium]|nr:deaminase [Gemmatimonadota bacterium]